MQPLNQLIWSIIQLYIDDFKGLYDNSITLSDALKPWLSSLLAITIALTILTYPPSTPLRRTLSMLILALPTTYAFKHHLSWVPSWALCDSFARGLYIWYAHMSHEILLLHYVPRFEKDKRDTFHSRFTQARKVLFAYRSSTHMYTRLPTHAFTRGQFLLRHAWKMMYLYFLQATWHTVLPSFSFIFIPIPTSSHDNNLPSHNTFNASLLSLHQRLHSTISWCIINMLLYESHHSLFALLFVGSNIDSAAEWDMALFGSLREAYTVRSYWGRHWHRYISSSFAAHVKVWTRRGWGKEKMMRRGNNGGGGCGGTMRIVENTLVFALSGVGHAAVRWMQDYSDLKDWWFIGVWYVAQMGPIVLEAAVQGAPWVMRWRAVAEKRWPFGARRVWKGVGYVWVVMWFVWCCGEYIRLREEWIRGVQQKKYKLGATQGDAVSM